MMAPATLSQSRRTRRTPFSPRVEAAGVKSYTVYNHMLLATVFESVEADYTHLKQHVQIWDVGCERQVSIQGPDAARLVQLMTVRDIGGMIEGQCFYAPLVDTDGGMINDPVGLKLADDHYWLSLADSDVLLWARGLATGLGLDVATHEPDVWPLAIQGPKSDDLMAQVFGESVRDIRFFRFERLSFNNHPFVIARSGWSKQGGFEIYVDREDLALELWDALWEAGQPFEIRPGCPNHIERIEGGLLSYGNDMTRAHNPLECGLDRYCHVDRPIEALGRDAVAKVMAEGTRRLVRGLKIDGGPVPPTTDEWSVQVNGKHVGGVTSSAYSPDLASTVAFAMMDKGFWDVGLAVKVVLPDGTMRDGSVSDLPFI
ncbi:MAG: dimethylsulfoniopropionate demethylase [Rhodospirillales bacterium]|nr:dimethylsulfoniopropionate demethylase [Rhodospirillales bacterium]MBT4040381.1 dimethylsulfoniopropionate demethylase [Rhodospirillales bacterium]MBT4627302.1 dimethylsulfoniopropionate demethylase [Rhodospirillales bacterium]MBT5351265.1 dimethylsulfoniopropionate demethylase [Rhodospirillales bacterium]MBT5520102.1 dimethylsulfoniopropionate demethylase [Rhodospirillales bacterium]